ncbi:CsxC family protein [Tissierellaceae bacterium HCP3S3_D8]|jgi:hypothetical protein
MTEQAQAAKVSDIQVIENGCGCNPSPRGCVDVDSKSLNDCPNIPVKPHGIKNGAIVKIPVVLAELTVRFFVNAMIDLPEPALEIKDIKKRLKITQCLLLQPTNVLFIKGFVRKNIDYSTRTCSNREGVCGEIHHCTVDVPFECTTPVKFFREPAPIIPNQRKEFEFFRDQHLPNEHFAEKDRLLSGDLSEFNQISNEFFNELPFCELISSTINEFDEFINRRRPAHIDLPFEEKEFRRIEEKMVIELKLKILQKQQVEIPRTSGWKPCDVEDDSITSFEE